MYQNPMVQNSQPSARCVVLLVGVCLRGGRVPVFILVVFARGGSAGDHGWDSLRFLLFLVGFWDSLRFCLFLRRREILVRILVGILLFYGGAICFLVGATAPVSGVNFHVVFKLF